MLEEPDQVPMTFGVTSGTSIVVIRQIELVKVGQYLQLSLVGTTMLHVRDRFPKFTKCLDKSTWIFFSYPSSGNHFILCLLLDRCHRDFGLSQILGGELPFFSGKKRSSF